MSFGGGYNGGRTRMGCKVYLNLYDLSPANEYMYPVGLGFYHSGIEVLGSEYSFGSGGGIFDTTPQQASANMVSEDGSMIRFRSRTELGVFEGGQSELRMIIDDLRDHFKGNEYNLIKKNCNHFANALSLRLIGKPIPAYINRITDIALCCSCLLPKKLLEGDSPVDGAIDDSNSFGNSVNNNSNRMVRGAPSSNNPTGQVAFSDNGTGQVAFSGKGARLGGSASTDSSTAAATETNSVESVGLLSSFMGSITGSGSSSASTTSSPPPSTRGDDSLIDRREKARKAALARLELQQTRKQQEDGQNKTD